MCAHHETQYTQPNTFHNITLVGVFMCLNLPHDAPLSFPCQMVNAQVNDAAGGQHDPTITDNGVVGGQATEVCVGWWVGGFGWVREGKGEVHVCAHPQQHPPSLFPSLIISLTRCFPTHSIFPHSFNISPLTHYFPSSLPVACWYIGRTCSSQPPRGYHH